MIYHFENLRYIAHLGRKEAVCLFVLYFEEGPWFLLMDVNQSTYLETVRIYLPAAAKGNARGKGKNGDREGGGEGSTCVRHPHDHPHPVSPPHDLLPYEKTSG